VSRLLPPDRAVHRACLTGHATTSGRQEAQRLQGVPPTRRSRS
jgi:hypothetical protein